MGIGWNTSSSELENDPNHICPECGKFYMNLGSHRRLAHGIGGKTGREIASVRNYNDGRKRGHKDRMKLIQWAKEQDEKRRMTIEYTN